VLLPAVAAGVVDEGGRGEVEKKVAEGAGRACSLAQVPSLRGGRLLRSSSTMEALSGGGSLAVDLLRLRARR